MVHAEGKLTGTWGQGVSITPCSSRGADILLVIEGGVNLEIEFDTPEAMQLMSALGVAIARLQ